MYIVLNISCYNANKETSLYLLSSTNGKALIVAFNEVHIISSPVVDLELGLEPEQERLSCSIEMITDLKGT